MKKINNLIYKNINFIIIIFLFLQPFLDILTALSINYFNFNLTIGAFIRLLFLLFCIYYLLFINKNRNKLNISYLIICIIYFILFSITIYFKKDISVLFYELKNLLNTFYLPIVIITLYNINKDNKLKINLKHIVYLYLIYLLFTTIPSILNIGFKSYSHSKLGNVGWFLSANALGNTLSILLPFIVYYIIKSKDNLIFKIVLSLLTLYTFLTLGTKVPILSIILVVGLIILIYYIKWIKNKEYKKYISSTIIVLIVFILGLIAMPKTTFYKNLEIHRKFLGFDSYTEIFTNYTLIDKFIFSERLTFLNNTRNSYKKASTLEKIVGIGYIENYNTKKESTKTIEIDYCEVLYRHGILGSIIYFSCFIYFLYLILKYILKNKCFEYYIYFISIIVILLLSLFSGHLIVTPCVSIFVALIFTYYNKKALLN